MADVVCQLDYLYATAGVLVDRVTSKQTVDLAKEMGFLYPLRKIKTFLLSASLAVCDADEQQIEDLSVRRWLCELTEVLHEADEIMDDIEYEALDESVTKTLKVFKFKSYLRKIGSAKLFKLRIENVVRNIDNILKQGPRRLVSPRFHSNAEYESQSEYRSAVFGRDAEKESLMKLLLSENRYGNNAMRVIPVVGMGGIGKTSLARAIYNDSRHEKHFDVKVWVRVQDDFDVLRLTKTIYEAVSHQTCDSPDLSDLQFELCKALKQQRFFLVLDDVWKEDYYLWDVFRSPFTYGAAGSAILLTTRSKLVASFAATVPPVCLCVLSEQHSWQLFTRYTFEDSSFNAAPDLETIGRKLVGKCGGLPLAIISLSGILRVHPDPKNWEDVLHSSIWEQPDFRNSILPTLWLSYDYLPSHLKQCFVYLSLFPKEFKFDRKTTILLWMADGLLQRPAQGQRLEDVGDEYFDDLISRSMLQESHSQKFFTMHDLVHDMAAFVSEGFRSALPRDNKLHSFLAQLSLSKEALNPISVSSRVLTLSHDSVERLPDSLGGLLHLRFLNLSFTKVKMLPDSICRLYHLQTLLLIECKYLTRLPTNLRRLVNLRHLNLRGTSLEAMPPKISALTNLQTLSNFVVGKHSSSRIKELGPLQLLHGNLEISRLENVIDVVDLVNANLEDKKFLSGLGLNWSSCAYDSTKGREALDVLCPIKSITKLEIKSYSGMKFPEWIGSPRFFKLVKVCLVDCKNCCSLPSLGQLPLLQELEINGFDGLRTIGVEFYYECSVSNSARVKPFRSLELLILRNMREWQEWLFVEVNNETGPFPLVKEIVLECCPKLNVCLSKNLPSLKTLKISECKQLMPLIQRGKLMDSAFPSLLTVRIIKCSEQETFLEGGLPSSIKALTIWSCPKLKAFKDMGFQNLASLQHLSINNCHLLNFDADECAKTREKFRGLD